MSMIIFSAGSGAAQPTAAASGVKGAPEVRQPGSTAREHPRRPVMDEYIPEEKQEPSGRYWPGRDGDGQPKVHFDDPERDRDADGPGRRASKKEEICRGSTDKVDREIERLRKEREQLKRQVRSETDGTKKRELETELARVEQELRQKDSDAYRRQHMVVSRQ